jgi:hypothetical protein
VERNGAVRDGRVPANVAIAELLQSRRSRVLGIAVLAALQAAWVVSIYAALGTP